MEIQNGCGDSFHFARGGKRLFPQRRASGSEKKVRNHTGEIRLQITVFWVSCRPSCWPNGQDVGRHDGRHEKPENAYTSWIFLFDRVLLANLTIEKNDFPRASSLYGHVNTFSASLSKKNFISVGRQTKLRKHVSCVG